MNATHTEYLSPTDVIDCDHPEIRRFAAKVTAGSDQAAPKAVALFRAVRDGIRYFPYLPFFLPEHYRASRVLAQDRGYCITKAVLLCALSRAAGIEARLGFATIRNHLADAELLARLGSDRFVFHGYTELYLHDRWVKATPAFDAELCRHFGIEPLPFDGCHDAVFPPVNSRGERFVDYVEYHGTYSDLPLDAILEAWHRHYGAQRVKAWIEAFEAAERERPGGSGR